MLRIYKAPTLSFSLPLSKREKQWKRSLEGAALLTDISSAQIQERLAWEDWNNPDPFAQ